MKFRISHQSKIVNRRRTLWLGAVVALGLACFSTPMAHADDGIFPATEHAKPFIDFDGKGFMVNGKRTFIASAGLEYARIPRELWRDRLLQIKRAGLNCVELYLFWNFHEPQEGKFNFSGDHDLDAFLKLAHSLGLYVIARPGPYYCAEWDLGGYPLWLKFKPGVQVRADDPEFEKYVDRFFDKLLPIVASNQISRGGSVILVQLENEHTKGWGREMPNGYFTHLRDKAVSLGIEVPYFFSGLHHSSDPAGNRPWDSENRTNPWMSTEFWTVWYDKYGESDNATVNKFNRNTWKIIANGGNGYNYYMFHGGTNFGYTNNNEDASSYDYGAAIGQAGDLRRLYYRFKNAALFARSFSSVLENSRNATETYAKVVTNPSVLTTARQSPAGTILFLNNPTNTPQQTQINDTDGVLPAGGPITIAPTEIMPIIMDYTLLPNVTLHRSTARILNIAQQGATTSIVIHGAPGSTGEMAFDVPAGTTISNGLTKQGDTRVTLKTTFSDTDSTLYRFKTGSAQVRVISVSDTNAEHTWFVDAANQSYIAIGPNYVGDATLTNGKLRIKTETPWNSPGTGSAIAYGESDTPIALTGPIAPTRKMAIPALTKWEVHPANTEAAPNASTIGWLASDNPIQMGADGDLSCYAWYRSTVNAPQSQQYHLAFDQIGGSVQTYVDGKRQPDTTQHGREIVLDLTQGQHSVAFFTEHFGRDKLFNHIGAIDTVDAKGLNGQARLLKQDGEAVTITDWQILKAADNANDRTPLPAGDAVGWAPVKTGDDVFGHAKGVAWFRATLPASATSTSLLHFESIDDQATVFLNGKKIGAQKGWNQSFDVPLGSAWQANSPNILTVLITNTDGAGGIDKPVTLLRYQSAETVTGWKMRGGPGDPLATTGWAPISPVALTNGPAFLRTSFTVSPPKDTGAHVIWRVTFKGLSHGSIWLNGHNLGRYPERVAIDGLYLPEPWLVDGKNSLVIFDDNGSDPSQIELEIETAASRNAQYMTQK